MQIWNDVFWALFTARCALDVNKGNKGDVVVGADCRLGLKDKNTSKFSSRHL